MSHLQLKFVYIYCHLFISFYQLDYPSAVDSFEKIIDRAKNKKVAIFLDYDGTLSPIVDDPDCAFMSEAVSYAYWLVIRYTNDHLINSSLVLSFFSLFLKIILVQMRTTVRSVARYFPTAIISGRSRDKVSRINLFVILNEVFNFCLSDLYRCLKPCSKGVMYCIFRFLI